MAAPQIHGLSLLPLQAQKAVCWLLILLAGMMAAGRLASVTQLYDPTLFRAADEVNSKRAWITKRPTPVVTLSSNDRSRWLTVRSLLENGTYVIGTRDKNIFHASAASLLGITQPGINQPFAIPALLLAGKQARIASDKGLLFEDGWNSIDRVLKPDTLEFYSSKPPLFPTMLAGWTWTLEKITGWTLREQPAAVIRTTLFFLNIVPFVIYLGLLSSIIFQLTESGWVRIILVAAAAFGSLVTPFLITLNNHTPVVFLVTLALWCLLKNRSPGVGAACLCGAACGLAFTMELPSLAFLGAILVLWLDRRRPITFGVFLASASVFIGALIFLNYVSIGSFLPAYSEFGGPWYDYEGSSWHPYDNYGNLKRNIDFARRNMGQTRGEYTFHLLLGHHGLFSLTPIFLLSLWGGIVWLIGANNKSTNGATKSDNMQVIPKLALTSLGLTLILTGFYLYKSDNYGGMSCAPRWLMWLTPFLLVCAIPALEKLEGSRRGRWLAVFFLSVGIFSASWPAWTPWKLPWIYDLIVWLGWRGYF